MELPARLAVEVSGDRDDWRRGAEIGVAERRRPRAHHRRGRRARHLGGDARRASSPTCRATRPTRASTSSRSRSARPASTPAWRCSAASGRVSSTSVPDFDTAAFRDRFPHERVPGSGERGVHHRGVVRQSGPGQHRHSTGTANGDGIMWMVAQAGVGKRATRVISEVERSWFTMSLPRGIPLWAGGDLMSNGGGNNPKIRGRGPSAHRHHDDRPGGWYDRGDRRDSAGHRPGHGQRHQPAR